jgi:hypothetical protein
MADPVEQPTMNDILNRILTERYNTSQGMSESKVNTATSLVTIAISALAQLSLPPPRQSPELRNNPDYTTRYAKWMELRREHEARGTPIPSIGAVFGRTMLLLLLPMLKEAVRKRAAKTPDIKPLMKPFFDEVEIELNNPRSEICGAVSDVCARSAPAHA